MVPTFKNIKIELSFNISPFSTFQKFAIIFIRGKKNYMKFWWTCPPPPHLHLFHIMLFVSHFYNEHKKLDWLLMCDFCVDFRYCEMLFWKNTISFYGQNQYLELWWLNNIWWLWFATKLFHVEGQNLLKLLIENMLHVTEINLNGVLIINYSYFFSGCNNSIMS